MFFAQYVPFSAIRLLLNRGNRNLPGSPLVDTMRVQPIFPLAAQLPDRNDIGVRSRDWVTHFIIEPCAEALPGVCLW